MSSVTIDELFSQALQGDYDNDDAWQAINALRLTGAREVFEGAAEWCRSNEQLKRARGADILGQLGKTPENPSTVFPEESFKILCGMLESERDPVPLSAVIAALGHLGNPSAIPLILPFSFHPDTEVRFDLAFALGCFAEDKRSVATLLKLMTDKDSDVRDWATFGLGVLGNFDSPEIREALFHNLSDPEEDVREEAMVGLAKRKDLRSLPETMKALANTALSTRALDAANFILERTENPFKEASECLIAMRKRFLQTN